MGTGAIIRGRATRGIIVVNVVPLPGLLSTVMVPPWLVMMP
jgi:hypothetical protein